MSKRKIKVSTMAAYVITSLIAFTVLIPILWLLVSSFKTDVWGYQISAALLSRGMDLAPVSVCGRQYSYF